MGGMGYGIQYGNTQGVVTDWLVSLTAGSSGVSSLVQVKSNRKVRSFGSGGCGVSCS